MRTPEGEPSTNARSRRRAIAFMAAAVLVGIGVAWGALKMSAERTTNGAVSIADGARFVFVPSGSAPQVAVIDAKSGRVVTRIELAGIPDRAVVSDAADVIAASVSGRDALEIVPLSAPASRIQVKLPITPESLVLSPDGYLLAVADGKRGAIAIVSLQQRKLLFTLSGLSDPRNSTFSLDGSQLYVTDGKSLELAVVDIVQQKILERVALGREPSMASGVSALTRTADGRFGFVSLGGRNSVAVIDLRTLTLVKSLAVGGAPLRAYGTADGRLMLVPNDVDRSISVIDTTTLQVAATLPGAKDVIGINTGWFESHAFVLSASERRVTVLDLMKFVKLGEVELPAFPAGGVVDSAGQKLYVALTDSDQAAVIDTRTMKLAALIDGAGRRPWGALMTRSNNYCH